MKLAALLVIFLSQISLAQLSYEDMDKVALSCTSYIDGMASIKLKSAIDRKIEVVNPKFFPRPELERMQRRQLILEHEGINTYVQHTGNNKKEIVLSVYPTPLPSVASNKYYAQTIGQASAKALRLDAFINERHVQVECKEIPADQIQHSLPQCVYKLINTNGWSRYEIYADGIFLGSTDPTEKSLADNLRYFSEKEGKCSLPSRGVQ